MKPGNWINRVGQRLLLTDRMTRIERNEWTLLEVSPNGKVGKFRNETAGCQFWTDLNELLVMDELPAASGTTDLLAPERCEKCGFLGHKASDCEYPFPQGHRAQLSRLRAAMGEKV